MQAPPGLQTPSMTTLEQVGGIPWAGYCVASPICLGREASPSPMRLRPAHAGLMQTSTDLRNVAVGSYASVPSAITAVVHAPSGILHEACAAVTQPRALRYLTPPPSRSPEWFPKSPSSGAVVESSWLARAGPSAPTSSSTGVVLRPVQVHVDPNGRWEREWRARSQTLDATRVEPAIGMVATCSESAWPARASTSQLPGRSPRAHRPAGPAAREFHASSQALASLSRPVVRPEEKHESRSEAPVQPPETQRDLSCQPEGDASGSATVAGSQLRNMAAVQDSSRPRSQSPAKVAASMRAIQRDQHADSAGAKSRSYSKDRRLMSQSSPLGHKRDSAMRRSLTPQPRASVDRGRPSSKQHSGATAPERQAQQIACTQVPLPLTMSGTASRRDSYGHLSHPSSAGARTPSPITNYRKISVDLDHERQLLDAERARLHREREELAMQKEQFEHERRMFEQSRLTPTPAFRSVSPAWRLSGAPSQVFAQPIAGDQRMVGVAAKSSEDDVVTLNVGGELVMQVQRATLRAFEGSLLAHMFAREAESKLTRDSQGRIFVECRADVFVPLVNFLRQCRRERMGTAQMHVGGSANQASPTWKVQVPQFASMEQSDAFASALRQFGLAGFVHGSYACGSSEGAVAHVGADHSCPVAHTAAEESAEEGAVRIRDSHDCQEKLQERKSLVAVSQQDSRGVAENADTVRKGADKSPIGQEHAMKGADKVNSHVGKATLGTNRATMGRAAKAAGKSGGLVKGGGAAHRQVSPQRRQQSVSPERRTSSKPDFKKTTDKRFK